MKALMKHINIKKCVRLVVLASLLVMGSCEDFVTVPAPNTQLFQELVFEDEATAIAALASLYFQLASNFSFADGYLYSVTFTEALYSDELVYYSATPSPRTEFYLNSVTPFNAAVSSNWNNCYKIIYESNRIIEGASVSVELTESTRNKLLGEAYFIRAFCHFYLVNLFGDVPLITSTNYTENANASRSPIDAVYVQITSDLQKSKDLLSDSYPSAGRVRVNKSAAIALLARVYLYTEEYARAEAEATEVISKTMQYTLLQNLDEVFLSTSTEAIWQLLPKGGTQNYTNEGLLFILRAAPTGNALRAELYNSLEDGDLRKIHWIGSITSSSGSTTWYFPYKYKENVANATGAEYSMVMRLAEQYLIRAEARAMQDNLTGLNSAQSDINAIRDRAGLPNTTASSKDQLLAAIAHERRAELFTEWGHRFFDLKRTGKLNEVLPAIKPNWNDTDALLPIPQSEMLINQNLKPQNPGY